MKRCILCNKMTEAKLMIPNPMDIKHVLVCTQCKIIDSDKLRNLKAMWKANMEIRMIHEDDFWDMKMKLDMPHYDYEAFKKECPLGKVYVVRNDTHFQYVSGV